mmetsp:Transcript_27576/g.57296  ORF Transcript_27576/g.57296 Transcript_27576/m.57296 type:complete len:198 (-) Transcript_27576:222-815(-)
MLRSSKDQQSKNSGLIVEFPTHRYRKNVKKAIAPKHVTFSVNSTLHMYITHVDDDDDDDKDQRYSSWYTRRDYESFRSDSKADIASYSRLMANDIKKDRDTSNDCEKEVCSLEIEMYLSQELYVEVTTGRSLHKRAVFTEQVRQVKCYGCFDDWNEMAIVSKKSSAFSNARAIVNEKYLYGQVSKKSSRCSRASRAA